MQRGTITLVVGLHIGRIDVSQAVVDDAFVSDIAVVFAHDLLTKGQDEFHLCFVGQRVGTGFRLVFQRIQVGAAFHRNIYHNTAQLFHERAILVFRVDKVETSLGKPQEQLHDLLFGEHTLAAAGSGKDHGIAIHQFGAQADNKVAGHIIHTIINTTGYQHFLRIERNQRGNIFRDHGMYVFQAAQAIGHSGVEGILLLKKQLGEPAVVVDGSGF